MNRLTVLEYNLLTAVAACADDEPAYLLEGVERRVATPMLAQEMLRHQRGDAHACRITSAGRRALTDEDRRRVDHGPPPRHRRGAYVPH